MNQWQNDSILIQNSENTKNVLNQRYKNLDGTFNNSKGKISVKLRESNLS